MNLVGRIVSHYQILEKLGAGGMGDIYKAQDTKLNRFVAVKVLSSVNAGDPERRRRFVQEAQAASGLNHPNIITIHDIVNEGDGEIMVMEYVTGKTLIDLIPKGGLRVPLALKYGVQLSDALSAAHAAGIIHRDLKPGNVMVTDTGLVKVLDFGLAKLTDRGPASQMGDSTQTLAETPLTVEGSIVGTVSYMSPEQAQGKKVDLRSDIFSFGVVFYEMLTGSRAFNGDSALSTLSAILRDEHKPMVQIAPDVPPQLEMLITRCLRKSPDERWQSMRDVLAALAALKHESDSGQLYKSRIGSVNASKQSKSGGKPSNALAAIILLAVLLVAGGGSAGGWWWMKHRKPPQPAAPAPIVQAPAPVAPPVVIPTPAPIAADRQPVETILTNDGILEMVQAKLPAAAIIGQIRSAKTNFILTRTELIRLIKGGVPPGVLDAMRDPKHSAPQETKPTKTPSVTSTTPVPAPTKSSVPVSAPAPAPAPATAPSTPVVAIAPLQAPAAPVVNIVAVKVGDGLPVSISLVEAIPTDAEEGRPLHFVATDGLSVGDAMIIAKGAKVTGSIVEVAGKKKFLGMGGGNKMTFRLIQVDAVDGRKLTVRATPTRVGEDNRRPVESGAKGKNKEIAAAAGSAYVAYIDGEQTVSVRK